MPYRRAALSAALAARNEQHRLEVERQQQLEAVWRERKGQVAGARTAGTNDCSHGGTKR